VTLYSCATSYNRIFVDDPRSYLDHIRLFGANPALCSFHIASNFRQHPLEGINSNKGSLYFASYKPVIGETLYEIQLQSFGDDGRPRRRRDRSRKSELIPNLLAWYQGKDVPHDIILAYRRLSNIGKDEVLTGRDLELKETSWALLAAWIGAEGEHVKDWSAWVEVWCSSVRIAVPGVSAPC
jgi:hypothetical protein